MTNAEILGDKLFELRKKFGLSQEELAERLNVSRQAVSKWERGESLPDTDNLITISKLYGVSLDELVGNINSVENQIETVNDVCDNDDNDALDTEDEGSTGKKGISILWHAFPYPILITVIFLIWGFVWDGWYIAWTLYITVPLYHSIIECFKTKKLSPFAYPVLVAFIYVLIGMKWGLWHPYWVVFITIPIYYAIAEAIDSK
jgi:transcriptional regulator with XRE-family HTH domain